MYVIASGQRNITKAFTRPDCQNKNSWNQMCVLAIHNNFDGFSPEKLYQQRISRLHFVMKLKIYNFPEKSKVPKFRLPMKTSWPILSAVSGVEMNTLQRSDHAHFLFSQLS